MRRWNPYSKHLPAPAEGGGQDQGTPDLRLGSLFLGGYPYDRL